jgi:DNA (cytosine-5)-methyltransferase 1
LIANGLVKRYGKGTDSDATDTLIAGPLGGGNDGAGRRSEDDPNLVSFDAEFSNQGTPDDKAVLTRKLRRAISDSNGVRRLTPTECERLQALPDGWTAHGPDSRRYAALGDAVTATVAEWIGRRLIAA